MDGDVVVIVHQQQPSVDSIIGRALLVKGSSSSSWLDNMTKASKYKFGVPEYGVLDFPDKVFSVYIDISTLQVLTR